MNGRIVEIADRGQYLSMYRGFMVVNKEKEERGRVPLADIAVLLLTSPGNSLSTNLVNALLEQNAMIVFCGDNFQPSGLVWPTVSHHLNSQRLQLQISASQPLKKRLWQMLIRSKISHQQEVLGQFGGKDEGLEGLINRVGSGDPENCEAQAARRYWPRLLGAEFRRDPRMEGINSLLNYGYAVVRSATARAIAAVGLHPSLGIHHHNQANPFCLADDLMEPFRPLVDWRVRTLVDGGEKTVTPEVKKQLAGILDLDLSTESGTSPLSNVLLRLARSLVKNFEEGKARLDLPRSIIPVARVALSDRLDEMNEAS
jgi:CRISPR-associated protein Cas1